MNAAVLLAVAVAGGLGAGARYLLDALIPRDKIRPFPVGLMIINLSGSGLLGLVAGLAAAQAVPPDWLLVAGTGFLGGYTTFSAASLQTVQLLTERRLPAALVSSFGMLLGCVATAAVGLLIGLTVST